MDVNKYELTGEQTELFNKLTKLQKGIATHTIEGMKPADAHKAAGGKCKNEANRKDLGNQILSNPHVKAFLDSIDKTVVESGVSDSIMSRKEALELLTNIGRSKLTDVLELNNVMITDADGKEVPQAVIAFKNLDDIGESGAALLQEIKVNPKTGEISFKTHDQKAAVKQIADMMGYNRVADEETGALTQEERILNMTKDHAVTDEKLN